MHGGCFRSGSTPPSPPRRTGATRAVRLRRAARPLRYGTSPARPPSRSGPGASQRLHARVGARQRRPLARLLRVPSGLADRARTTPVCMLQAHAAGAASTQQCSSFPPGGLVWSGTACVCPPRDLTLGQHMPSPPARQRLVECVGLCAPCGEHGVLDSSVCALRSGDLRPGTGERAHALPIDPRMFARRGSACHEPPARRAPCAGRPGGAGLERRCV